MNWNSAVWITVSVLSILCGRCYGENEACKDLTQRVVGALDRALGFFAREYEQVNLDAVVGIRMAQSQLQAALEELVPAKSPELKSFCEQLTDLTQQAEAICQRALPMVKRQYPKDYKDLGILTSGAFWKFGYSGGVSKRKTDPSSVSSPRQGIADWEPLSEPLTDRCIGQLLGTRSGSQPCSISPFCWLAMTPRGYRSYSLSHQVLYLTVGSLMGCESHMKRFHHAESSSPLEGALGGSLVDALMEGFCSDILAEARSTADAGFQFGSQDLFMEQVLLCGLKGYKDFFQLPWLQAVLSWQDDSGCFTNEKSRPHSADEEKVDTEGASVVGTVVRERRREKEITETGCLLHKTAVGAGFLSIYLRTLLDTMATENNQTNCF